MAAGDDLQQWVVHFTEQDGTKKVVGVMAADADTAKKLVEIGYGGAKVTRVV